MNEVEIASKSVADLFDRLPNIAGLIDTSLDWQYMIEVMTVARAVRPDFQLVSGTEYMISAAAIGATGLLSPLGEHCARAWSAELYALCWPRNSTERPGRHRKQAAILFRALRDAGVAGSQSRACGQSDAIAASRVRR